jgi:assimilatory nitrate reductase catalytic subunit
VPVVPRFLQGVRSFDGRGLGEHQPCDPPLAYEVPAGVQAQLAYLRAGSTADQLVCVAVLRDGEPMRLFPVGARASVHVPLRIAEDLQPGVRLELAWSAPEGVAGQLVLDLGLLEL